jgi:hypothetical protein
MLKKKKLKLLIHKKKDFSVSSRWYNMIIPIEDLLGYVGIKPM